MRRGPFIRWSDLPRGRLPTPEQGAPQTGMLHEWCRNDSGVDLPAGSVAQCQGHVVSAAELPDAWRSQITVAVSLPDVDHAPRCGILLAQIPPGKAHVILFSGVAYARLTGPMGQSRGGVQAGSPVLLAGEQGLCEILDDPGPADEERLAIVRIGDGDGRTDAGGDGGDVNCGCVFVAVGSETCLEEHDSPAIYIVSGLGAWLRSLGFAEDSIDLDAIPVEFDGDCTWLSDELTRPCYEYGGSG